MSAPPHTRRTDTRFTPNATQPPCWNPDRTPAYTVFVITQTLWTKESLHGALDENIHHTHTRKERGERRREEERGEMRERRREEERDEHREERREEERGMRGRDENENEIGRAHV